MSLLLGKSSAEPGACTSCGRRAGGIGLVTKAKGQIAWVCGDVTCIHIAKRLLSMNSREIDTLERRLIHSVSARSSDEFLEVILSALYDADIRTLDDIDSDKFAALSKSIGNTDAFKKAIGNALQKFSVVAKEELQTGVPF